MRTVAAKIMHRENGATVGAFRLPFHDLDIQISIIEHSIFFDHGQSKFQRFDFDAAELSYLQAHGGDVRPVILRRSLFCNGYDGLGNR